ncbi:MAG: hypothetical protein QS721_12680 [Candidatus Endonucleobacter sp. (ex Gigantidas childressi)]|nr:hypothetical protein [Candidatus Endonucleobacter sp. (ex Gigantidas childressi)]
MLAAFAHPDHLLLVGSRDFAYLLPSSNLKCFGYMQLDGNDFGYLHQMLIYDLFFADGFF